MMKCPICSSSNSFFLMPAYDDRYGYEGRFFLHQCKECDHKFLHTDFNPDGLKNIYTDYYPRSALSLETYEARKEVRGFRSWLNGERRLAYSWVPENVRVLDIGCGFGETLGYHRSRGCDVYGVEVDENIRRVADKFQFNVHVGTFNPDMYDPGSFDYVTMDQVIEHVTDPLETLRGIARILKPGGLVIISTPNASGWGAKVFGSRWINWHAPYHLHHFSFRSMKSAAGRARLVLEKSGTITSPEWLYYQWNHLVTYPVMGTPSVFWSPKSERSLKQKISMQILSIVHRTGINHLITRLFDALGSGDNYLFIFRKSL
jgi:2-polyprenyl-3-methyl-5-hydroxy-6-metoxy-1,4-benzoquinol methylase